MFILWLFNPSTSELGNGGNKALLYLLFGVDIVGLFSITSIDCF